MKRTDLKTYDLGRHRLVSAVVIIVAILSLSLQDRVAHAANLMPDEYRIGDAIAKFDDTSLYAVAYKLRSPRRLRAQHLELTLGTLSTPSETRSFISLGPVWQVPLYSDRVALKFGFSPTVLNGSTLGARDLGGNFHFTSSASIEAYFGLRRALSLAIRIQHTSNGGLSGTNPGMDIAGLSFSYIPGN